MVLWIWSGIRGVSAIWFSTSLMMSFRLTTDYRKFPLANHTSFFSPSRTGLQNTFTLGPIIMNVLCIGVPIALTVVSIGWAIALHVSYCAKAVAYEEIVSLTALGKDPSPGLFRYSIASGRFLNESRWACCSWSMMVLLSVLVRKRSHSASCFPVIE